MMVGAVLLGRREAVFQHSIGLNDGLNGDMGLFRNYVGGITVSVGFSTKKLWM